MSMPKFPEIDPEITCERALNMILASIAMEELALSHILNAEGEKLQYVLGTLETSRGMNPDIDEVLKINNSITSLLDSVSQNQMILKNKMDKALHVMSEILPRPPVLLSPPCPQGILNPSSVCSYKSSAFFKAFEKHRLWCPDTDLYWNTEYLYGRCACLDTCDNTKIELCTKSRFLVNLSVNVKSGNDCKTDAVISLKMLRNHKGKDIYTVHRHISCDEKTVTISIGGIIIENYDYASTLLVKLESIDSLIVEDSMLSVIEI